MARFNEINIGRWNRFLQKLTGIKGGPPAPQLSSEISVSQLIFHGAENRYIEQWNLFALNLASAAVAAQNSAVRLRNPAGSNVAAVVEWVSFSESVVDNIVLLQLVSTGTADLGTLGTALPMDSRSVITSGMVHMSTGNNIVSGGAATTIWAGGTPANTGAAPTIPQNIIFADVQEIPLMPGSQLTLLTSAVNTVLTVNFRWRERFLEESERA